MTPTARAQSEVIGVALLLGVVVVVTTLVGAFVLLDTDGEERPLLDVRIEVTPANVTVTHAGGDEPPAEEFSLVVGGATRARYRLPDVTESRGNGDGQYELGEVRRVGHGTAPGESVRVLLVHRPSGRTVADRTVQVPRVRRLPPAASFTVDPASPGPGQTIQFDARGSRDFDGTVDTYRWDFGDGTTVTTSDPTETHTYGSAGTYTATLTVTDSDGLTDTVSRTVRVDNAPPSATLSFSKPNPDEAAFDASGSTDPDGTIAEYRWDFGDGTTQTTTGPTVTHPYADGTYSATVTVVGSAGGTATATVGVTIDTTAPSVTNPQVTDDGDGLVTSGDEVTVSADVTDATSGVDTVTADLAAFGAGTVTLDDGNSDGVYDATATVGSAPTDGAQTVDVTATDAAGNSATVTTGSLRVDTTPPQVDIDVTDRSSVEFLFGFIPVFAERYDVTWTVADASTLDTTVYVNRSGTNVETFTANSGDETNTDIGSRGTQYTFKLVAVDAAGNRVCRVATDAANGNGVPAAAFSPC